MSRMSGYVAVRFVSRASCVGAVQHRTAVAMVHVLERTTSFIDALVVLGRDYNLDTFRSVVRFCQNSWAIPAVFCVMYLAMVYAARKTIAKHRYLALADKCFAAWNLRLSRFSCWGLWHMAWAMLHLAAHDGLQFKICSRRRTWCSASMTCQPLSPFACFAFRRSRSWVTRCC